MPEVEFGDWTPDRASVGTPGLQDVQNMYRTPDGYTAFNDLKASSYQAMGGVCRGARALRTSVGGIYLVAGVAATIYVFTSDFATVRSAGPYNPSLTDAERWTFDVFGTNLFATYSETSVPAFSDGAANFAVIPANATNGPSKAKTMAVHRDFLLLGNIDGVAGTGSAAVERQEAGVHWSGLGLDPSALLSWPQVGTAAAADAQSGYFIFEGDGGPVTQIVSTRDFALVFRERQVWRLDYVGSPVVWSRRKIDESRGCPVPGSAVSVGGLVYYIAQDGFSVCDGSSIRSIGFGKVDETLLAGLDTSLPALARVSVTHAAELNSVIWSVPHGQSSPNFQFCYNYELDQWWNFRKELDWVLTMPSLVGSLDSEPYASDSMDVGTPLEDTYLDTLLHRDTRTFAAVGTDHQFKLIDTEARMNGTIITSDFKTGERTLTRSLRPDYAGSGVITGSVAARNRSNADIVFPMDNALNDQGRIPFRAKGRYLQARFNTTGQINNFQGFDPYYGIGGAR